MLVIEGRELICDRVDYKCCRLQDTSSSTVKVVVVDVCDTTIQIMVIPDIIIESGFQTWSEKSACCIKFSFVLLLNKL
jgi:hypothetical protein